MITAVTVLFLELLIISILHCKYPGTDAFPLDPETDWMSVHRQLNAPDTIHFSNCLSPISACSTISDSSIIRNLSPESSATQQCSCQCKADAAAFLPSIRSCINKLDECQQQIPFQLNNHHDRLWLPTFSIPATNSIFAPTNKILWNEVVKGSITENGLKCSVSNVFVQTDDLWTLRNNSVLFKLESHNRTNYLMWKGSETDAKRLEGSIVQLKISCDNANPDFYCIGFRIAGIHVNANLAYHFNDVQWNRVELIICVLLTTLLGITLCGGVALWKVCWKSKKSKLISTMQMQFLYHMKQQQAHMEEQIASIKASVERHSPFENDGDQSPSSVGMQKRKLYFSADFFEPELMANPPLLAVQFVYELRKMIDIAKDRIRMKRHVPTLTTITEDSESDEYLEIPRPPSRMNDRTDEPSPKSLNSTDSGCDSMSDDDVQNQHLQQEQQEQQQRQQGEHVREQDPEGNQGEVRPKEEVEDEDMQPDCPQQHNTSQSNKISAVGSLLPRPVVTKAVQVSRIPTIASSRLISPMTPSPRLSPKPSIPVNIVKTLYDKQNGENAALENAASSMTSKLPSPISMTREPPNLERILSNVPPPLPESTPPSTPPPSRNRLYSGRRRAYAVFPSSDLMLKKSLPRRSKRQQRPVAAAAVQASLSLSTPSSSSSSSSASASSPSSSTSSS